MKQRLTNMTVTTIPPFQAQEENLAQKAKSAFQQATSTFSQVKMPAPAIKVGQQIAKPVLAINHLGDSLVNSQKNKGYARRFGAQLLVSSAKTALIVGAAGVLLTTLPTAATSAIGIGGMAMAALGARGLVKSFKDIKAEGNGSFKDGFKNNPEKAAKLISKALMTATGAVGMGLGLAEGLEGIINPANASSDIPVIMPDVPDVNELGNHALDSIDNDNIVSPIESQLNEAANNVASATPEIIADMGAPEIEKLAEDALVTADALDDGKMGSTHAGQELVDQGLVEPTTVVAESAPEVAEQIIESVAQEIMAHSEADLSEPDTSEVVKISAENLVDDGQFGNDAIAVERLEAVVEADGIHAEEASLTLQEVLANQEAGVTSYTIESGDNLTKIIENNDVYSAILDSVPDSERNTVLNAIIDNIADMNGLDNRNEIFVGQEIVMKDLSGIDPSTLEITRDIAAENTSAGMSHYNKPTV